MSADGFNLYFDAETIAAGNARSRGLLDIPTADENDTLYVRAENDKKWREHLSVKETTMLPWDQDKDVAVVTIQYRVTEEGYEKNQKRVFTKRYFINTKAVKDSNHKDYKKTIMNIGKLNSLIRACGVDLEKDDSGRVPYHTYFIGEKPLVGKVFWGVIRDYTYKNRDGEVVPDQDIDNFIKAE